MKKMVLLGVLLGLVVVGFVYYIYLGGFAKIDYASEEHEFSAVFFNCSDIYYDDACFQKLNFFLDEQGVDSHTTISVYESEKGFFDKGFFDKGVILDRVELSRLGENKYNVMTVDKRYITLEFPQKNWMSFIVADYRVNKLIKKKFFEQGYQITENMRIYDSVDSRLIYLLEVEY